MPVPLMPLPLTNNGNPQMQNNNFQSQSPEEQARKMLLDLPQGPLLKDPRREYMIGTQQFAVSAQGLQAFQDGRWRNVSVQMSYNAMLMPWLPMPLSWVSRSGDNLQLDIQTLLKLLPERARKGIRTSESISNIDFSEFNSFLAALSAGRTTYERTLPDNMMFRVTLS